MAPYMIMHPDTLTALRPHFEAAIDRADDPMADPGLAGFAGLRVVTDAAAPRFHKRWAFPADPFIEHEESDLPWCRFFGIGGEVDDTGRPWLAVIRPSLMQFDWMAGMPLPGYYAGGPTLLNLP